jgi:hypothetical protein
MKQETETTYSKNCDRASLKLTQFQYSRMVASFQHVITFTERPDARAKRQSSSGSIRATGNGADPTSC